MADGESTRPSDVSGERGWFDAFADRASTVAASSTFFVALVVLTVAWVVVGPLTGFSAGWVDTLQVVGMILTLLLVVLLENEEWRNSMATQRKLNALASALAHILESDDSATDQVRELKAAIGLEKRESISD